MRFEHAAIDVADPVAVAGWYVEHLGLKVAVHLPQSLETHFLTDDAGSFCLELYRNPVVETPDYHAQSPVTFHVAYQSDDPARDAARLQAAGATFHAEITRPGAHLIMLRDPWGVGLQLCRRDQPLV